jgi:hypothetical protein
MLKPREFALKNPNVSHIFRGFFHVFPWFHSASHVAVKPSAFPVALFEVGRLGGATITLESNGLEIGKGNFASRHEAKIWM